MNFNIDAEINEQNTRIIKRGAESVRLVNGVLSLDNLDIEANGVNFDDVGSEEGNEVVVVLRLRPMP